MYIPLPPYVVGAGGQAKAKAMTVASEMLGLDVLVTGDNRSDRGWGEWIQNHLGQWIRRKS